MASTGNDGIVLTYITDINELLQISKAESSVN